MNRSNLPPEVGAHVSEGPRSPFAESGSPLAAAYAAYQRTAPSERELILGVARVRARLQARRRRFRPGSLLAFALVFVGALAYAAGAFGGRPFFAVSYTSTPGDDRSPDARLDRPPGAVARDRELGVAESTPAAAPDHLPSQTAPAASGGGTASRPNTASRPALEPSPTRAPRPVASSPSVANDRSARGAPERTGSAAWAVVAESMAAKDYARAEGALRELASSDVSDTRNNARLGLAQLALGRGDCAEARRLAERVLEGTPSPQARRRGEQILARCSLR